MISLGSPVSIVLEAGDQSLAVPAPLMVWTW